MASSTQPEIELIDREPDRGTLRDDVLQGLGAARKTLPCKYLYDARGSALFERICALREYYPTRTELGIMQRHAREMARHLGPACLLIEYGSGSSRKTRLLLDHLETPAAYVPVDISRPALERSVHALSDRYPTLEICPVCADYTEPFELPECEAEAKRRAAYFPGSTVGNFSPSAARDFLADVRERVGPDGALLIGVDLKKDPAMLEAAYDDGEGVTAEFNLNLLERLNRELDAEFDLSRFRHRAIYNRDLGRVEMHLVSEAEQEVRVAGERFRFREGETIHTESSYKYALDEFEALAGDGGFRVENVWCDPERLFSVQYLTPR